jgi:PAS domain S-box-containing protein
LINAGSLVETSAIALIGLAGISLVLAGALLYVASHERRIRGLKAVAAAFAFNTVRFLAAAVADAGGGLPAALTGNCANIAACVMLLYGGMRMAGLRVRPRLLLGLGFCLMAVDAAILHLGLDRSLALTLRSAFGGFAHLALAWGLFRLARDRRFGGYCVAGVTAAGLAVLRLGLPELLAADLKITAIVIAAVLYFAMGVSLIVALQRTQIVELKLAKQGELEAHRRTGIIFNNSADLMAMMRVEPRDRFLIEHVNRSLVRAMRAARTGRPLDLSPGRDMAEVLPRDFGFTVAEAEHFLARFREAAAGGAPVSFSATVGARRQDAVLTPIADEQGRVTHIFYRATDVTERHGMQERFETLFDLNPVPLAVTREEDGVILRVNDAWLALHGHSREQAIGRRSLDLGLWPSPADRAGFIGALRRDGAVRGLPNRVRIASGETREMLLFARRLDWGGERVVAGFELDVTAEQNARHEIERLNASLEERVARRTVELEEALGEMESFTYSVSHDLRAPLRAMTGFADMLARRPAVARDDKAVAYALRVSRAAARMGRMVDALLRYTRLGRQPLAPRAVALAPEAAAIAAELDAVRPERRVRWDIGPLPEVRADAGLLRQVLLSLMDNAVKFSAGRDEARIAVSAEEGAAEVSVRVRDNGSGFDPAYAGKLFTPFQRLEDDPAVEGIGMGLAYVARIVDRHGGRVWCEAAPGEGATFGFSLPR